MPTGSVVYATKGARAALRCSLPAGSDPGKPTADRFVWYKDQLELDGTSGPVLSLPAVTVAAQGNYSCAAANSLGAGPAAHLKLLARGELLMTRDSHKPKTHAYSQLRLNCCADFRFTVRRSRTRRTHCFVASNARQRKCYASHQSRDWTANRATIAVAKSNGSRTTTASASATRRSTRTHIRTLCEQFTAAKVVTTIS